VIVIEASEESGSPDLPFYIEHLASRIGHPRSVVCLDSGCGNYQQLWLTTSLRGMVIGPNLTVRAVDRRGTFGRGRRHRTVVVPHPAPASVAHRG